jgi:hypothetical protein
MFDWAHHGITRVCARAGLFVLLACSVGCSDDHPTKPSPHPARCIDYDNYLRWITTVDTPGEASGVAVSGTYAYVADSDAGLSVIDIADPLNPQVVGNVTTPDAASATDIDWGVAVSGDWVYLADGGVRILPAQCDP